MLKSFAEKVEEFVKLNASKGITLESIDDFNNNTIDEFLVLWESKSFIPFLVFPAGLHLEIYREKNDYSKPAKYFLIDNQNGKCIELIMNRDFIDTCATFHIEEEKFGFV